MGAVSDENLTRSFVHKINHLSDVELSYIAGVIDGEGNVELKMRNARPRDRSKSGILFTPLVSIANTDGRMIDWLREKIGAGSIWIRQPKHKNHTVCYSLQLTSGPLKLLLPKIRDFSVIKKEQIDLVLLALGHMRSGRKQETDFLKEIHVHIMNLHTKKGGLPDE